MGAASTPLPIGIAMYPAVFPLTGCQVGAGSCALRSDDGKIPSNGVREAPKDLCDKNPAAKSLAVRAKGAMVSPGIVKGGLVVGDRHAQGPMIRSGQITGACQTTGLSYGLQAGLRKFVYALFFMDDADMAYLDSSKGWEIRVGPNITVVDSGLAASLPTTTAREGVDCWKGLMAGLGLQGSKITRMDP